MIKPARSITEQVYRQLKADLVRCLLQPGERLRTKELSVRFEVSLGVVREALSRLTSDGLVEADPQRGFRAAPISSKDLIALTEASIEIEAVCIRKALASADSGWEQRVRNALDCVTTATASSNALGQINEAFLIHHQAFHDALVSGCNNAWLLRMRYSCHLQGERYRQICVPKGPDLDHIYAGYDEIAEAALARDVDRTISLVSEQLQRNSRRFVAALEGDDETKFWSGTGTDLRNASVPAGVG
jgi:DNA-binding GntR family transcriptional regulator